MTDFQKAREALGLRLRELRESGPQGRITGTALSQRLGWGQSKVSKLENGRQTATPDDLREWTEATGQPDAYAELLSRLRGFESHMRSWRRQLAAGQKPVQDAHNVVQASSTVLRAWESSWVVGVLQTPDYARAMLTHFAELHHTPRDIEEAVRSRMRRQEGLYAAGKRYEILLWEAVLHAQICPPPVLAAQLDRLLGVVGLDTVELGIVPLGAPLKLPPGAGFWIYDDRLVTTETWHAEMWLDDADSIATHLRVWKTLRESAVFGAGAQHAISRVRRSLAS
ncbi:MULTISPECIES: helix-turn-helix transcriptional regulator [unclassified Streptomyces]|uniref:helix-turn-helix domain-containing protein n=1 Tax=unclassified Streptomyces TaxID=2593676 RepID=UPI000DC7E400|nr:MULTISPECIES: helix-turn-helix transcriptional regulator [unclassified Streptomyces]AWZ10452.1 transcriptional regulator [Streptomyces sp. ICC4]AWZ18154.1 transcriptional regulator [Streptomyces sp. ICC1]